MVSKYLFLGVLYFVQGLPHGLQSGLLPIYLRTVGHSFTRIGLTKSLFFPWLLKVVWAPFVDQYWTKQTWLLLTMCALTVACLICATLSPEVNFTALAIVLILMNVMAAVQDVAVDGMAVKLLSHDEIGYGNTVQVVAYKLGNVLAGGVSLTVIHRVGWSPLFLLLAFVYSLVIIYTWQVTPFQSFSSTSVQEEKPHQKRLNPWEVLKELLRVPGTPWTLFFVFNYKLGEQGAMTMFPLFLLDSGFSSQELGFWCGMVAMCFSIAGSALGGALISRKRSALSLVKTLLIWRLISLGFQTIILLMFTSTSSVLKAAAIFSIILQHFLAGMITTFTFSIMMQCTQKAAENIQATHYSFLATVEVLGKLTFSAVSGGLVDAVGFVPSFFLFLLLSSLTVIHIRRAPVTVS
ncbi:major facilitator superfamily domain-containing protein 3 isoform X1 [Pleurodeles waltl]|uniref:major facilitator superfamily domain-containing protein 3 isoform X1 n=1 Tax=Pleurodeles waltl TaxID=8319 RepID=UPI0037097359